MASSSPLKRKDQQPHWVLHSDTSLGLSVETGRHLDASFGLPPSLSPLYQRWLRLSDYQKEAVLLSMKMNAIALIHDQGVGKTISALVILALWHLQGKIREALVVCPLSVLPQWEQAAAAWAPEVPITFINYERVSTKDIRDAVVVDELQYLKNRASKRSKIVGKLGAAPYRLGLTGTPVDQDVPSELWAEWRFIEPGTFGIHWVSFRDEWLRPSGFMGKEFKLREDKRDLFWEKVRRNVHHVRARDVLNLPPNTTRTIRYPLTPRQQRMHDELMHDLITSIGGRHVPVHGLAQARIRMFQIISGYLEDPLIRIPTFKLKVLERCLPATGQFIVFVRFKRELRDVVSLLTSKGIPCGVLSGQNRKHRNDIILDFNKKEFRALVAQVRVGGVGLNLQVANLAIFYSRPESYIDLSQAKARIYRRGQEQETSFIILEAKNSIDELLTRALQFKRTLMDQIYRELK